MSHVDDAFVGDVDEPVVEATTPFDRCIDQGDNATLHLMWIALIHHIDQVPARLRLPLVGWASVVPSDTLLLGDFKGNLVD